MQQQCRHVGYWQVGDAQLYTCVKFDTDQLRFEGATATVVTLCQLCGHRHGFPCHHSMNERLRSECGSNLIMFGIGREGMLSCTRV